MKTALWKQWTRPAFLSLHHCLLAGWPEAASTRFGWRPYMRSRKLNCETPFECTNCINPSYMHSKRVSQFTFLLCMYGLHPNRVEAASGHPASRQWCSSPTVCTSIDSFIILGPVFMFFIVEHILLPFFFPSKSIGTGTVPVIHCCNPSALHLISTRMFAEWTNGSWYGKWLFNISCNRRLLSLSLGIQSDFGQFTFARKQTPSLSTAEI